MYDPLNPSGNGAENAPQSDSTPRVEPVSSPESTGSSNTGAYVPPVQQSSGSYYSPRGGSSAPGGFGGEPVNPGPSPANPGGGEPPKKHKSHKVLKAFAIVAGIALLSYTSIQCYQFATENDTLRKFFGKGEESKTEESLNLAEGRTTTAKNTAEESSTTSTEHSLAEGDWVSLAAREDAMSIPDIVEKVMPSSVGVASTFTYQSMGMFGFEPAEQEASATGTGIIMSESGYIITNAHVIYDSENNLGLAKEVHVVLNEDYYGDETQLAATIVGYDTEEDIAVLKVDPTVKLQPAEFGSSDDLRVGELVLAIGNPLGFDLFGSVSMGIVSALDREVTINENTMRLIQTDTAINSGNSGGPLINSYGQVIGINSAKLSSNYGSASVEGLCFAIPMSHAKTVIDDLINYGYVRGKPLIGIKAQDVTEEISEAYGIPVGVLVRQITEGGAAALAGIKPQDVIIAVNGKSISSYEELNAEKDQYKAGDQITLTVTRDGQDMDFTLTLQEKKPSNVN